MDGFNSRDFYGYSLSKDPKLKTTTTNYEFKFNSPGYLEKVISQVRNDREKKVRERDAAAVAANAKENKSSHVRTPKISKHEHNSQSKHSAASKVESQVARQGSHDVIVSVMSTEEVEEMLASEKTKSNRAIHHKVSEESFITAKPQWVEINPTQKCTASIVEAVAEREELNIPDTSSSEEDDDDDDDSDDDISCYSQEKSIQDLTKSDVQYPLEKNMKTTNYLDTLSLASKVTNDFIIRNYTGMEINITPNKSSKSDSNSNPASPVSLDRDFNLNKCEQMELERAFSKNQKMPEIPNIEIEEVDESDEDFKSSSQYLEDNDIDIDLDTRRSNKKSSSADRSNRSVGTKSTNSRLSPEAESSNSLPFQTALSSPPDSPKSARKMELQEQESKTAPLQKSGSKKTKSSLGVSQAPICRIEDLKQEKLRIFSKMTTIQQKLLKNLDSLRINLVEISMPDDDTEKKTREKNALEFTVRFSRNYLFPLGKMLDDLRQSPKEDYHSALTNEPCVKVCGIYGMLREAVACYQKQIKHLFTTGVPKKLDILLNLIKDTTTVCLTKQIFDKRDILIQSLLGRCDMFLAFVKELGKKKTSTIDVLHSERRSRSKLSKTSSKWDLTMSLNNLNMYEPKLVPKKPKIVTKKQSMDITTNRPNPPKPQPTKKSQSRKLYPRISSEYLAKPTFDDLVETQVHKDSDIDCLKLIDDAIAEQPDSDLTKAVIETLQDITKDEVHHMFGPIVSNLDSILKSSDKKQRAVDSVINVIKTKLEHQSKGKQHKVDDIATENNTQINNNNTHHHHHKEKEEKTTTKKHRHSGKDKQQSTKESHKQQQDETKNTRKHKTKHHQNNRKSSRSTSRKGNNKNNTNVSVNVSVGGDGSKQTESYATRTELTDSHRKAADKQSTLSTINDEAVVVEVDESKNKNKNKNNKNVNENDNENEENEKFYDDYDDDDDDYNVFPSIGTIKQRGGSSSTAFHSAETSHKASAMSVSIQQQRSDDVIRTPSYIPTPPPLPPPPSPPSTARLIIRPQSTPPLSPLPEMTSEERFDSDLMETADTRTITAIKAAKDSLRGTTSTMAPKAKTSTTAIKRTTSTTSTTVITAPIAPSAPTAPTVPTAKTLAMEAAAVASERNLSIKKKHELIGDGFFRREGGGVASPRNGRVGDIDAADNTFRGERAVCPCTSASANATIAGTTGGGINRCPPSGIVGITHANPAPVPVPTATAARGPLLDGGNETKQSADQVEKLMYCRNALYTFIKYLDEDQRSERELNVETKNPKKNNNNNTKKHHSEKPKTSVNKKPNTLNNHNNYTNYNYFHNTNSNLSYYTNPTNNNTNNNNAAKAKKRHVSRRISDKAVTDILEERETFIQKCKDDPLYNNPQFPEPWKVLSKISNVIATEIFESLNNVLSNNEEENFVRDFIDVEIQDK